MQSTLLADPVLAPGQAGVAVTVAWDVAARLREPGRIEAAITAAKQQTVFPKSIHWQPYSVAQGYAGLAVMASYLDACFPDEGWDVAGHHYLDLAARGAQRQGRLPAGLFAGLGGLAFATWRLSRGGIRYRKLLAGIEDILVPQTMGLARSLCEQKRGISVHLFDAISGLSGIGAYLLCRREEPGPARALQAVLRALVQLTRDDNELPGWHTPPRFMADEAMLRQYPDGNLNCGLAHGIPGPLALMSLAWRAGIGVDGMAEAVERIAIWLCQNRLDDAWGVNWPTAVPLDAPDASANSRPAPIPSRTAWCYGSPGIARALWLAGEALAQPAYCKLAVQAMEAVYRRPLPERRIDSPTFCHGVAGLLQITLRFARDTGLPVFRAAAGALGEQILAAYEPQSLLGYRNLEPGGQAVDQPGLLDGAPGVVLALLAAATGVEPAWDRLFLLA